MKDVAPGSVDVIIIDSTDPVGPAEGLFGLKFYRDCITALKPDGMLVQQSESPLLHLQLIQDMHAAMKQAGFAETTLLHFPQVIYPSGWWSGSIALRKAGSLVERLEHAESLDTQYYNRDMHRACFALPNFVKKALAG